MLFKKTKFYHNIKDTKYLLLEKFSPFWNFYEKKINTFDPNSSHKLLWDLIILFFLILNVFYIPFNFAFELSMNSNSTSYFFLEILAFWVFVFDIVITLNTGFYFKGTLILNKERIIKNYAKNKLLLDFITLGPYLIIIFLEFEGRMLQLLFLLRIIKMKNIMKKIKEHLLLPEQILNYLKLIKLLFLVIYLAHVCGCVWHYVALVNSKKIIKIIIINFISNKKVENSKGYKNTWLHKHELIGEPLAVRYINSLFYSVLTMVTVGFIDTDSATEKGISIILVFVLSGAFAYSLSSISTLMQDLLKNDNELKLFFFFKINEILYKFNI